MAIISVPVCYEFKSLETYNPKEFPETPGYTLGFIIHINSWK